MPVCNVIKAKKVHQSSLNFSLKYLYKVKFMKVWGFCIPLTFPEKTAALLFSVFIVQFKQFVLIKVLTLSLQENKFEIFLAEQNFSQV